MSGQGIGTVMRLGDQPLSQRESNLAAVKPRRMTNGAQQISMAQARHQILHLVHRLGKAIEPRALTQKFRPHGDNEVECAVLRLRLRVVVGDCRCQQMDK
jgi:hypothetical protein